MDDIGRTNGEVERDELITQLRDGLAVAHQRIKELEHSHGTFTTEQMNAVCVHRQRLLNALCGLVDMNDVAKIRQLRDICAAITDVRPGKAQVIEALSALIDILPFRDVVVTSGTSGVDIHKPVPS